MISETKLDSPFPQTQFCMNGFSKPSSVDRNNKGLKGGDILYKRRDYIEVYIGFI